jgi:outer membrane receptor protein involved in Fe transport
VVWKEIRIQKSEIRSQKPESTISGRARSRWRICVRKAASTLCVAALFALGAVELRAATLRGTVLDPDGRAVAHAGVSLLSSLKAVEVRQTDASGKYIFENLQPGAYELVSTAPGMSSAPVNVGIAEGESRTLDVHLKLSAVEQQVVVSASLGGALAPEIGSSVSVVSRNEIEQRGAENAYEALSGVPGLDVNQTGRRGGATGVFIRGGNSNYNLVMVDGIPLNQFGGDFDFASLPADGLERIEVARGPESALYGSNAVTGVVNFITRRGDGPPRFTALAEAGSFNTHRFSTGASGLTRGWSWAFDLSQLISQGVVANDRYRDQSAIFSLGYDRNQRRQVNFHFFGNANDAGGPGPYGSDPDNLYDAPLYPGGPTSRQAGLSTRDKQNLFGYSLNYAENFSSRFRQVTTATLETNDYLFAAPAALGGNSYSLNRRGTLNTRSEIAVSNQDFLVAGIEYSREQIRNTYIADANNSPFLLPRASWAFFVENRWTPSRRLFITAGLRADHFCTHALPADAFGSRPLIPSSSLTKVDPRVSVAYMLRQSGADSRLGQTRLHGSFGTGIREPNGFELAFTDNPSLKPERNVSFDFGVEQRAFASRAVFDATYFYNRFEDQIVVLGGSLANLSTFTSANLGNSRAQGLELSLRVQPLRSVQLNGEYTLDATTILALEGTNVALSPFQVGQPLIRRPKNSGFFNVTWQHRRLALDANAYVRGPAFDIEPNLGTFACVLGMPCFFSTHGYTRADAGFTYRLPKGLELYGRLNNFLNQKYEESLGYPALRLNFLVGMKFNFPAE